MLRVRRPHRLAPYALAAVLALAAAGCGGSQVDPDEVPGPPPALTVPMDEGASGGDAATDADTSSSTTDPDDASTTDAGADTGATAPDAAATGGTAPAPATGGTTTDPAAGATTTEPAPGGGGARPHRRPAVRGLLRPERGRLLSEPAPPGAVTTNVAARSSPAVVVLVRRRLRRDRLGDQRGAVGQPGRAVDAAVPGELVRRGLGGLALRVRADVPWARWPATRCPSPGRARAPAPTSAR